MNYPVMPEAVLIQKNHKLRLNQGYRFPSVSIFMPFNPKMEMKNKIAVSLAKAREKVEAELNERFGDDMSLLVIQKLRAIIKNLDFNTHNKSLAIFLSPVFEKIYYLNIDLETKIIVNESLQIQELLYSKKQSRQFHIMLITERESRIFLSDTNSSIRIINQGLSTKEETITDSTHPGKNKQFLQQIDQSLQVILKYEQLPVFIMGEEELISEFKNISDPKESIIEYVPGNFKGYSFEDLKKQLNSYIGDWQKINQKNILHQLKEAEVNNKLFFGLDNVWHEVINRRGRLLLLDKKLLHDGGEEGNIRLNFRSVPALNKYSNLKNRIETLIEKVLENGGDVELVNTGLLNEYSQIALIKK